MSLFPIIEVTADMRGDFEQLGSKPKFWFRYNDENWLFKEARANTGEDWSEKLASEIASLLGLPTHRTQLATWQGKRGCAALSFLPKTVVTDSTNDKEFSRVLIHGNELLGGFIETYDKDKEKRQVDHTIENIIHVIEKVFHEDKLRRIVALKMIGYLVFDALVGNTDRHHQNWGVVLTPHAQEDGKIKVSFDLAPTFDHASSLGRELRDETRKRFMQEQLVQRYSRKGTGGIFENATAKHGMSPIALAETLASRYPEFFKPWQSRVKELDENRLHDLVERIPPDRISALGKSFALTLLLTNKHLILNIP